MNEIFSPVFQIPNPPELRNWYRRRMRHEERLDQGKDSAPPTLPLEDDIFPRENFIKFVHKYLLGGYLLGGFQELDRINCDVIEKIALGIKFSVVADEQENDIYEDEEIELSDDEAEEENDMNSPEDETLYKKFCTAISTMFQRKDRKPLWITRKFAEFVAKLDERHHVRIVDPNGGI